MKKRIISALIAASVLFGTVPGALAEKVSSEVLRTQSLYSASSASNSSKSTLDNQAYSALGFKTDIEEDNTSFFGGAKHGIDAEKGVVL